MDGIELERWDVVGLAAVAGVLLVVTTIGFLRAGPARWVKISTFLLLANCVALRCLFAGWQSGLQLVGITGGAVFTAVSLAFLTWRHPVTKVFSPATVHDCPRHARATLDRWTRELEESNFTTQAECRTVWQLQGQDRVTFVRFLVHHSEPLWVEIHALDDPKVVARMVTSDKGGGRAVMTCDRQADQELFEDSLTAIQRVPSASACAELLDAHRKLAMSSEGRLSRVEDPVQAHVELYGGWVQRLLESGQVRRFEDDSIGLRPATIPGLVLKTWAAWFH